MTLCSAGHPNSEGTMKLSEVKFSDLSDITYRMFLHEYPISVTGKTGVKLLVIEFAGKHGIGSEGNNDSLYMATIIKAAMNIWYVDGLVLDFKHLEYEWGNSIGEVILAGKRVRGKRFPTAVVVSELCEPALKSAQPFYALDSQSGEQVKWLFDDFESAASYVKEQD
jgi:hypothetical protein